MRISKLVICIFILFLFIPLVQFAFLYRMYIGFPSYLKFEGTGLLYYGYSSLVNYTIEGPGRFVSGVTYEIKMCFSGYFVVNNKFNRFSVPIATEYRM